MNDNDMTTSDGQGVVYVNDEEFRPSALEDRLLMKVGELEERVNQLEVVMYRLIATFREAGILQIEYEEEN
jgi:hypothetical protein